VSGIVLSGETLSEESVIARTYRGRNGKKIKWTPKHSRGKDNGGGGMRGEECHVGGDRGELGGRLPRLEGKKDVRVCLL